MKNKSHRAIQNKENLTGKNIYEAPPTIFIG
jgi:hypothetical protein